VALLTVFSVTHAQVLPQLAPGDVGLAKDRLERISIFKQLAYQAIVEDEKK
jgi:hypothetical protein